VTNGRRRNPRAGAPASGAPAAEHLKVVGGHAAEPEAGDHPSRWSRPEVCTIAVASGKGGVGKSNLAANVAVALGERGAKVLLVDCDFFQANLDLLLGLHPRHDLQHVLSGEKTLEEIVTPGPANVTLVPAASGAPELAELDDFRFELLLRGIGQLAASADLVVLDLASGISRQVTSFCLAADEVLVVTSPEMPAFSDAYALIKVLHARGLQHPPRLVVNQSTSGEEAEETAHRIRLVARRFLQLDVNVLGAVPYDAAIPHAVRRQEPVVTAFPQSPAAAAYRAIAAQLWSAGFPDPALPSDETPQRLEA